MIKLTQIENTASGRKNVPRGKPEFHNNCDAKKNIALQNSE